MIRDVLKMGDARLHAPALPVTAFDTPSLRALLQDMRDTMASLDGAGLAAPQIGVGLRVVIFGVEDNPRYPEVEPVPETVLINPVLSALSDAMEDGWEGCLSVPGLRGWVPRHCRIHYRGVDEHGQAIERTSRDFTRASCNTSATISTGFCIRCASATSHASDLPKRCSRTRICRGKPEITRRAR